MKVDHSASDRLQPIGELRTRAKTRPFDHSVPSASSSEPTDHLPDPARLSHSFGTIAVGCDPGNSEATALNPIHQLVLQREPVEPTAGMAREIVDAIGFLNYLDSDAISAGMVDSAIAQLEVIESSEHAEYCRPLTTSIRSKLPERAVEIASVPLSSRMIHGIWVQGDYRENSEVLEGLPTFGRLEGWHNLIWVYQRGIASPEEVSSDIPGVVGGRVEIGGIPAHEIDFKATIDAWEAKPEWVQRFIPLLDVLLEKRSYVTMSDIMRMIILYYQGGLYADCKIQLATPAAHFFAEPMVKADRLQLADGGSNTENWAMIAQAGCALIEEIMIATLEQFPTPEQLARGPVNYEGGKYSKAHVSLHERLGPWNRTEFKKKKTDSISSVNPSLRLTNPRPENSWAHAAGEEFDWKG